MEDTIETWKLDLDRLLWSYHENGRPDGKTGVIGNPKTIDDFVEKLISQAIENTEITVIKDVIFLNEIGNQDFVVQRLKDKLASKKL